MPVFTFIATDEHGQVKKDDSKLIRSSCMRGKNERPDSRRAKRRTKRSSTKPRKPEPDEDGFINISASNSMGASLAVQLLGTPLTETSVSDASLLSFLGGVDYSSRDIVNRYLTYCSAIELLYPIERCIEFPRTSFLEMMTEKRAFLDIAILITSSINDFVQRSSPSLLTITYLRASLAHLNRLISEQPTEDNLFTIFFLALSLGNTAAVFGDYYAASTHIQGLHRIATIRGGKEQLDKLPKLNFKISRLDLTYSLCTGNKPVWTTLNAYPEPASWQPYFSGSQPLPPHLAQVLEFPCSCPSVSENIHFPKFAVIYNDLRCFTMMINSNIAAGTYIPTELFYQAIHSIQSRLIELDGKLSNDTAECVRLGMLALLTTTFQLPGPKMGYTYLHKCLRGRLQAVRPETNNARKMVFWVLVMSIIAVAEIHEDWIPIVWRRLRGGETEWEEVRGGLKRVMWIDYIHDGPGRNAFEKLRQLDDGV